MTTLDSLIVRHWQSLADGITKDGIRQLPSYGEAPLRLTMERVERWLKVLAESIDRNEPQLLAGYLEAIAKERQAEGYPIGDLHAIIHITERHIRDLIDQACSDPVERNGQQALLIAIMDSARMALSIAYMLNRAPVTDQEAEEG
ncbi:MAG: hypothetical protein PVI59_11450 [Anaerolineae bacterium]|jgi:hypothetical protein